MANIFNTILVYPLLNILFFFWAILPGHDFGIAVIILTLIIRLLLWPIVGKQLHSQKKLQAIQPEITKIRAEAKGDRQKESALLMELYKEKEVNPFSSCLPLVIQLPFLFGLFIVFRRATGSLATLAPHIYGLVKNLPFFKDLVTSPASYHLALFSLVNMSKPSAVLAVLAGVAQFIQARMLTPKLPVGAKKDAQTQIASSMGMLFPLLTVFIGLRLPAALALYWVVTTLVAILQQWLIMRGEVDTMEEMKITKRVKK